MNRSTGLRRPAASPALGAITTTGGASATPSRGSARTRRGTTAPARSGEHRARRPHCGDVGEIVNHEAATLPTGAGRVLLEEVLARHARQSGESAVPRSQDEANAYRQN